MITFLIVLVSVWLVLGLIAEVIGIVRTGEFNGIKNALIIIGFGLLSLLAVCMEIEDGNL